jgi:hypothetical protein
MSGLSLDTHPDVERLQIDRLRRMPAWRKMALMADMSEWYRLGSETSERQWQDALGVLKVQGRRLDLAYMRRMATGLGVLDLLERAIQDSP